MIILTLIKELLALFTACIGCLGLLLFISLMVSCVM